jgi:putative lipoic acid-binding regulatory protein
MMDDDINFELPNPYSLRVIGHAREDFEQIVHGILHKHGSKVTSGSGNEAGRRHSRKGNYVSITIQFTIENRAQLEAIYMDLKDSEHILMVL